MTHGPIIDELVKIMNAIAEGIDNMLNGKGAPQERKKYGFALLIFEFDGKQTPGEDPRINYVSNAKRRHMLTAMKEFIAKSEGRHHQPEKETMQ